MQVGRDVASMLGTTAVPEHLSEVESAHLLSHVETEIRSLVRRIDADKSRLCVCLHVIDELRLYRSTGAASFKEYLLSRRLKIAYQTAREYTTIGRVITREAELLRSVGYSSDDGLTKLRFLPNALLLNPDRNDVARHLKEDSFRSFRSYALGRSKEPSAQRDLAAAHSRFADWSRASVEDDTVIVTRHDGSRRELLWLNPEAFHSVEAYEIFVELALTFVLRCIGTPPPRIFRSETVVERHTINSR